MLMGYCARPDAWMRRQTQRPHGEQVQTAVMPTFHSTLPDSPPADGAAASVPMAVQPSVVHFGGYELDKTHKMQLVRVLSMFC
jgi:hypothetical protein